MMRPRARLNHLLLVILLLLSLTLAALPATAQEATAEAPIESSETPEPVGGLSTLMLLIGIGAVAAVGGVALLRERSGKTIS